MVKKTDMTASPGGFILLDDGALIHQSKLPYEFDRHLSLTSELYREYVSEDGNVYRIEHPFSLFILLDGSHRIVDIDGVTHRPPKFGDQYVVRWLSRKDYPYFVA